MASPSPRKKTGRRPDIWPVLRRRRAVGLVVLLALATIVAFERLGLLGRSAGSHQTTSVVAGTDHDRYNNRTFTCVKTVDGDTIDIDEPDGKHSYTRIRLIGVDTPETEKSPQGAMYFGAEASAFTRSQVQGKPVRIVLPEHETRDRYERLLAYVYLGDGDSMLNEEIIAGGYGYADTRFTHVWMKRFVDFEQRARKQKLGLWKEVRPDQMPRWRQKLEQRHSAGTGRASDSSTAR